MAWPIAKLDAQTSGIQGMVLDASRSAIAGADVTATSETNSVNSTTSDSDGSFTLRVPPGNYRLRVAKQAFSDLTREVSVGESVATLGDLILAVASVKHSIQVTEQQNYLTSASSSSMRTLTALRDTPQTINIISQQQVRDQNMLSVGDVLRYVPGVSVHQGENNRDEVVIRGTDTSSSFFVNGMRDDVQYYRDLYDVDRIEVLKGSNALSFGRGGGGGVVNRIIKEAGFTPLREISIGGGSFYQKRVAADFNQPLSERFALRMNAVYENSDTFRKWVGLERYAVNPTMTFNQSEKTHWVLGFENLRDTRTADRGITSYLGAPANVSYQDAFYGNPYNSNVHALVNDGSLLFEHQVGHSLFRNRTLAANYDRGYQNYVPGAPNATATLVTLTSYNNATNRTNFLNQSDFISTLKTGRLRHNLVAGADLGRQLTDNFRNTGFFNNTTTSIQVPFLNPSTDTPVTFRQSATDADNHLRTNIGATYVQDQVEISKYVQVLAGVRFDHFDLQFRNNRTAANLRRIDNLVSPRAGLVFKPAAPISTYLSYSVTYLPSSGDQFSSLTNITAQVKPEKFTNYEAGIKWDVRRALALSAAVYRLDRTNTRSIDPNDPTRIIQTGSQRSNGVEFGLAGSVTKHWTLNGGYAYQDAFITVATASAAAGLQVGQTPHHLFSLWNHYRLLPRLGVGLGLLNRSNMFATIDDTVRIPGYFRADAGLFYSITEKMRIQANVENLFDRKYILNTDSNTNLSPGSPRAVRLTFVIRF